MGVLVGLNRILGRLTGFWVVCLVLGGLPGFWVVWVVVGWFGWIRILESTDMLSIDVYRMDNSPFDLIILKLQRAIIAT